MAAERNFFHRWRGMTTIGYELGVIWEMSVMITRPDQGEFERPDETVLGWGHGHQFRQRIG